MEERKTTYLNADQVIFLPVWGRWAVIGILGALALSATVCGLVFVFAKEWRDTVLPALSVAQTAAGGFAIVLFVLFAEKQLNMAFWAIPPNNCFGCKTSP